MLYPEQFEFPVCAICHTKTNLSIDSLCSPECRREAYRQQGWKEPKNPKGWYVAEFRGYIDTVNYSPKKIKEWNKNVDRAKAERKRLLELKDKCSKKVNKIIEQFDKEFPFAKWLHKGVFYFSEETSLSIKEIKDLINAYEMRDKKRYKALNQKYKYYNKKTREANTALPVNERWLHRRHLKPNRGKLK